MTGPVVIDLGDRRDPPDPDPPGRPDPRRYRGAAAAVATALALGLGGAAPDPPPIPVATVPMALGESMTVDGDRLYVVSSFRSQPLYASRRMTAYRLPDGRRLWAAEVEAGGTDSEFGGVQRLGDALVTGRYDRDGLGELIGLDAGSGATRWRQRGWSMGSVRPGDGRPDRLLIGSDRDVTGPDRRLAEIVAVDPATGVPAWTYRVPSTVLVQTGWDGGDVRYLVAGFRSGRVEVRDAWDLRVLAATDTGTPFLSVVPGEPLNWLTVLDDLIVVQGPDPTTVTAYGLPALDRRWSRRLDTGRAWFGGLPCGGAICVQQADGAAFALDRRTGRTRWTAAWSVVAEAGRWLLASPANAPFGTRTPLALVDPATGRAVHQLGEWTIAGYGGNGTDQLLLRQDLVAERTWFGVVDPAAGRVRLLGVARGVVGDCAAGPGCLVCRRKDLTVGIWGYSRGSHAG